MWLPDDYWTGGDGQVWKPSPHCTNINCNVPCRECLEKDGVQRPAGFLAPMTHSVRSAYSLLQPGKIEFVQPVSIATPKLIRHKIVTQD